MKSIDLIQSYHAHIYFEADQLEKAKAVCESLRDAYSLQMGRMHSGPVGPHPRGSCQMTVPVNKIGDVMAWLSLNRDGLTIFTHPDTGQHLEDHRDRAIWMGGMPQLDLSIFQAD